MNNYFIGAFSKMEINHEIVEYSIVKKNSFSNPYGNHIKIVERDGNKNVEKIYSIYQLTKSDGSKEYNYRLVSSNSILRKIERLIRFIEGMFSRNKLERVSDITLDKAQEIFSQFAKPTLTESEKSNEIQENNQENSSKGSIQKTINLDEDSFELEEKSNEIQENNQENSSKDSIQKTINFDEDKFELEEKSNEIQENNQENSSNDSIQKTINFDEDNFKLGEKKGSLEGKQYNQADVIASQAIDDLELALVKNNENLIEEWNEKFKSVLTVDYIKSISLDKQIYLVSLLQQSNHSQLIERFPENIQKYSAMLMNRDDDHLISHFSEIKGIQKAEGAAIAHYIAYHKIPIQTFEKVLDRDQWEAVAPHLTYINLTKIDDIDFGLDLVKKSSTSVTSLIIHNDVRELPELPNCLVLDCSKCSLKELPNMPKAVHVNCRNCGELEIINNLTNCEILDCEKCQSLIQIKGELLNCKYLNFTKCSQLLFLPELPNGRRLICKDSGLQWIPNMPNCEELDYTGCILQRLPEVPIQAIVETGANLSEKLEVDLDIFKRNPKKYLLELGRNFAFKNNNNFPGIYYLTNSVKHMIWDTGGVARDFVSKLGESLFRHGEHLSIQDDDESNPDIRECYKTLGMLFAKCYLTNHDFKLHSIFPENADKIYGCLYSLLPLEIDKLSEENKSLIYLELIYKKSNGVISVLFDDNENIEESLISNINDLEFDFIKYTIDPENELPYTKNNLKSLNIRQEIKRKFLETIDKDYQWQNICNIAEGMQEAFAKANQKFPANGVEALQEKIEGKLTKELLIKQLIWKSEDSEVTPDQIEVVEKYLNKWIENANSKELSLFVRIVSANKTLGVEKLNMNVIKYKNKERDTVQKDRIPAAHTCSFSLDFSSEYSSQETFNKQMQILLDEAILDSGFSIN